MITIALIALPLIAGMLALFIKGDLVKRFALFATLLELALSVYAFIELRNNPNSSLLSFNADWIRSMGIHFNVSMDGISMVLVLLTSLLLPLIVLSSFTKQYDNPSLFYSLILLMQMALVGVFISMDGFLFYIFWELALIPIYFICLLWGGENRAKITFKFFLYTLVGSLFMLVGLIYLYQHSGGLVVGENIFVPKSFDINSLYKAGASLTLAQQSFVFWMFFLAFAIKMPIFPFHTWQPDTYVTAPTPGTMLLSGIMLKMGTYGLLRWLLPLVPAGAHEWANVAIGISVVGIIYASCLAIVQKDFKRLIAYSSIAHLGLISAGIFSFNIQGLQGGLIQMFAHGISVVGLFFVAEIILQRTNTRQIAELGGIRNIEPQFAVLFLIIMLGSVALPLTSGFIGEFLLINGLYQHNVYVALFAGLTVILGAVYMLRSYQGVMLGETNSTTSSFTQLTTNEKMVLIPIVFLTIALGVYPKPLMEIAEPALQNILQITGMVK